MDHGHWNNLTVDSVPPYKLVSRVSAHWWHSWVSSTDLCLVARGGCSHQCTVAPGKGVVCFCPPGLHLDSSNKTCEMVDYCSRHLKCSQVCEQYKTTVKCSCYPGWALDPDGDSCHSTGNSAQTGFGWRLWVWITFISTSNTKMVAHCAKGFFLFFLTRLISIIWWLIHE